VLYINIIVGNLAISKWKANKQVQKLVVAELHYLVSHKLSLISLVGLKPILTDSLYYLINFDTLHALAIESEEEL